jgi:hypothetical protein
MKMGFAPLVTVSCGENSFEAAIDTGLYDPLALPSSLLENLSREAVIEGKGVMGGGAFRDNDKPRIVQVNGIRIGAREIGKVAVTMGEVQENALIGYLLLSNYVVVVNYPEGEMLLIPTEGGRKIDNVYTTGMAVRRDDAGKTQVSGVWNGSPADRLGIVPGNEIVTVNGRASGEFTLQEIRDQLRDDRIKSVDLAIKTQSGEKGYSIIKEDLFRHPDMP